MSRPLKPTFLFQHEKPRPIGGVRVQRFTIRTHENYLFRITVSQKEKQLSRFKKLSQSIWHCQYHIVWVPKYRYKVLRGELARDVENLIRVFSQRLECEIIELTVQIEHVCL